MSLSLTQIIDAASGRAMVLTANRRLARALVAAYDRQMQQQGHKAWPSPQIISYQGWLLRCLGELGEGWRLLSRHQALRVWERAIEETSRGSELELLQLSRTAERAYEAYQSLREYQVSLSGHFLTDDQRVFQQWLRRFSSDCQKQQWLDQSELPVRICQALRGQELSLPEKVCLVGFDQLPPGLENLQQTCRDLGGSCEQVEPQTSRLQTSGLVLAQDAEQEMILAARWARRLIDQGETSIGVVVFDLQARRQRIERIFRDQLIPDAILKLGVEETGFTLSLGAPLSDQPVISAALELLSLGPQLSLEQAALLLRTPFIAGAQSEVEARGNLERELRGYRQQQIGLGSLKNRAIRSEGLSGLQRVCEAMAVAASDRKSRLPGAWGETFSQQLNRYGWPGEKGPSSSEYQALMAWKEKLLPELATLDPVSPPLSRPQAISLLRRLAREQTFQLESPTGPLQLLGPLEAAGLSFDHLWVMGLSENVLPAPARPNPFLPYDLQRQYAMPHADAARELAFAEQQLSHLLSASPRLVFSYPRWEGDCELRPSPLLPPDLKPIRPELADPEDLLSAILKQNDDLQQISDDFGPPLAAGVGSGGTGILKDQAHCPFRAFVHHRLAGRELDRATPGLDSMTRGELVHQVLERLWQQLQSQERLLALSREGQQALLTELTAEVLHAFFTDHSPSEQLLALEGRRIVLLLGDWLDQVERPRDPFQVIESEQQHSEQLGPLQISTKVDRIDQLANGERIVIDYKTGSSVKLDDLLGEPLLEPQLPLYAVAQSDSTADGIALARVQRGKCGLLGVVRTAGLLGRLKPPESLILARQRGIADWDRLLQDWRRQLEQLATDFVAGKAAVRPYDRKRSCQYCDLPGLCRINQALSAGEED